MWFGCFSESVQVCELMKKDETFGGGCFGKFFTLLILFLFGHTERERGIYCSYIKIYNK